MVRIPKLFNFPVAITVMAWPGRSEIVPDNRRMRGNVEVPAASPIALRFFANVFLAELT